MITRFARAFSIVALSALAGCGASNDSAEQPSTSIFPVDGGLSAITTTHAGLVAVGVGEGPLVLASEDAVHWRVDPVPRQLGSLWDAAYGNDTLVAVGPGQSANGHILTKPDAGDWSVELVGHNLESVLFGNGTFLATASVEPGARISNDGKDWAQVPVAGHFGFDGRQFVNSFADVAAPMLRVSSDGEAWSEPRQATSWPLVPIALVGEQVLSFGSRCADDPCTDGEPVLLLGERGSDPWELEPMTVQWRTLPTAIAANDERVVVVSANMIRATSLPVGSSGWNDVDVESRGWTIADVAYGSDRFVVVGKRGSGVLIATSADGLDWQDVSSGTD